MARKTRAERRLLAHLKEQFGEHLGALLLSGHGVQEWVRRRDFVISTTDRVGNREEHPVVLLTHAHSLPYGQDPLVLAAHLRLLSERGSCGRLTYDLFEMLAELGWVDPTEGLKEIERALFRYFSLSYAAVGKRRHPLAPVAEGATAERRILTAYDFEHEPVRGRGGETTLQMVVEFSQRFLDQLRQRSLFGIDWDLVRSVRTTNK